MSNNIKAPLRRRVNSLNRQFNRFFRRTEELALENPPQRPIPPPRTARPIRPQREVRELPHIEVHEPPKKKVQKQGKTVIKPEEIHALNGSLKTFQIDGEKGIGPKSYLNKIKPQVLKKRKEKKPSKVNFLFTCQFRKEDPATEKVDLKTAYTFIQK